MNREELIEALMQTLDDGHLSRSERKAFRAWSAEHPLDTRSHARVRDALFQRAAEQVRDPRDAKIVKWLADVVRLIDDGDERPLGHPPVIRFGPGEPMVETIEGAIRGARRTLDVAVFTITDDRLSGALLAAHRRGVRVRILSDNDKAYDKGSDVHALARAGLSVRLDDSPHHFHHKFAVIDRISLINGSYNWTRGADRDNRENFTITWDIALVQRYQRAFDELWAEIG